MAIVDSASDADRFAREDAWMFYYVNRGYWLLNAGPNQRQTERIRRLSRVALMDKCRALRIPQVRYPSTPHHSAHRDPWDEIKPR